MQLTLIVRLSVQTKLTCVVERDYSRVPIAGETITLEDSGEHPGATVSAVLWLPDGIAGLMFDWLAPDAADSAAYWTQERLESIGFRPFGERPELDPHVWGW